MPASQERTPFFRSGGRRDSAAVIQTQPYMKHLLFLLLSLMPMPLLAQGIQLTAGYGPSQEISCYDQTTGRTYTAASNVIAFDAVYMEKTGGPFYLGMGLGIRSFDLSKFELNTESDPFKKRKTRFDVNVVPGFIFGEGFWRFHLGASAGLWFAGVGDSGMKVAFTSKLMADVVLGNAVSVGVAYRPIAARIVDTDYNSVNERFDYLKAAATYEIRLGFFFMWGD